MRWYCNICHLCICEHCFDRNGAHWKHDKSEVKAKYLKVAALLDELEAHMQTQLGYTGQDNDISDKSTVSKHSEHIAYEK
jgi:hypothetical protein